MDMKIFLVGSAAVTTLWLAGLASLAYNFLL